MADNATLPATGAVVAADDIGSGILAQRVKPVWGADGTGTDTQVSQPLPVQATLDSTQMSSAGTIVTPHFALIDTASSGDTQLVATDSTHKIRVLAYSLVCTAAVAVKFTKGSAGTAVTGAMSFAANGGISAPFCHVGHFETDTTHDLTINLSGAFGVRGHLTYVLI